MTDLVIIIPARGGSKGLANKNSQILNGSPLLSRPISHAIHSKVDAKIYVTTDCPKLQKIAIDSGADCPHLRPPSLAEDLTTTEETLKFALHQAEQYYCKKFEYCMFMTCTDVYRNPLWISECYEVLKRRPELDSVFIGYRTTKNFWEHNEDGGWTRVRGWMKNYSSRQVRRGLIREDTGVCSISKSYLWRMGRRIGDKVEILVKDSFLGGLDIHSKFDLDLANFALSLDNE